MRLKGFMSVAALFTVMTVVPVAQTIPEVKLPASPVGQAALQLGGAWEKTETGGQRYGDGRWIVIDYSRPLLRGRTDIFGTGSEYGTRVSGNAPLWRAGANATTRLTTQAPLLIGGKPLEPGVYNVFVELAPGSWTLVLNTQPVQETFDPNDKVRVFGAYNYDPKFDVLRAPMPVRSMEASLEQFTIFFLNASQTGATLAMAWERTLATVDLRLAGTGTD